MIAALLVSVTMMIAPEVSGEEMAQYQQARAEAGRDANAQVKLALWCEQHGMSGKRMEHLALALMADPANATARGLMGLMKDGKSWHRPEAVAERIAEDAEQAEALAEYNQKREKAKMTADSQWDLALWCEDHGLEAEATAHLAAVVRLEPGRVAAWRRLGCKKHHGRWMTPEQIDAVIAEEQAQDQADKLWGPKLARLKEALKVPGKKADAEREIARIDAPRAVPTVWRIFARGDASDQAAAVQILAQTDAVAASEALAMLAMFGETDGVRQAAIESLATRDRREYLDRFLALLRKPLQYELKPIHDGSGTVELFVEGERYNLARMYQGPRVRLDDRNLFNPYSSLPLNDQLALQRRGMAMMVSPSQAALQNLNPVVTANPVAALSTLAQQASSVPIRTSMAGMTTNVAQGEIDLERRERMALNNIYEVRKSLIARELQIENDVAALNAENETIRARNERILAALGPLTGESFGEEPESWSKWWTETKGYSYQSSTEPKPTFVNEVPSAYTPDLVRLHHSCFAKGTLVHALDGVKPIETVRMGDRVLAQDVKTGELSYQTVLAPVQNPPSETFRVDLGSETIVATGIHRFWKAGEGWAMVRDLKPGDRVRTVGGIAEVQGVSADRMQPVFNLVVASDRNYFVGKTGFLVHDNSLIETVDEPFDAAPTLAAD